MVKNMDIYQPLALREKKDVLLNEVRWSIGIVDSTSIGMDVGMTHGPFELEINALETVGDTGEIIFCLTGKESRPTWRWDNTIASWKRISSSEEDFFASILDTPDVSVSTTAAPEFSEDQAIAWKRLQTWINDTSQTTFVLRGYAGTGKTFMLRQLQEHYGHRVVFTAPTNKATKVLAAAVGAQARTTYSALGLKMEQQDDALVLVASDRIPKLPADTILVIDEASMVGRQLRERVAEVCMMLGIRVIYVGDPLQLNPVGETRSEVWKIDLPETSKASLRKVMRFDNQLLQLATSVRRVLRSRNWDDLEINSNHSAEEGVWLHTGRRSWEKRWLEQVKTPRDCTTVKALAWRNRTVNALNIRMREHLGFNQAYCVGEIMLLAQPIEREGSIVAHTDDEFEICNVESRVVQAEGHDVKVWTLDARQVDDDWGMEINVPVNRMLVDDILGRLARKARGQTGGSRAKAWTTFWDVHRLFTDVRFGYAMTVHRAQGSTYRNVFVDRGDILANRDAREAHRCLYVGFTRPTTQLHIV
jgi:exodeoxyribonuclease-5